METVAISSDNKIRGTS